MSTAACTATVWTTIAVKSSFSSFDDDYCFSYDYGAILVNNTIYSFDDYCDALWFSCISIHVPFHYNADFVVHWLKLTHSFWVPHFTVAFHWIVWKWRLFRKIEEVRCFWIKYQNVSSLSLSLYSLGSSVSPSATRCLSMLRLNAVIFSADNVHCSMIQIVCCRLCHYKLTSFADWKYGKQKQKPLKPSIEINLNFDFKYYFPHTKTEAMLEKNVNGFKQYDQMTKLNCLREFYFRF